MPDGISQDQGKLLLAMARQCIAEKLSIRTQKMDASRADVDRSFLGEKQGLFVTLHKHGSLRGCIGTIEPLMTVEKGIQENAVHAAFHDSRFSPLTKAEFDRIDIEISLLTRPVPLAYETPEDLVDRLTPHQDGVVLEKGRCRATFLPQVWEQLPAPDAFLSQLCIKAGLDPKAWKAEGVSISVYRVQSFGETP